MVETQQIQMVDLVGQYSRVKAEVEAAQQDILNSGWFVGGPYVQQFKADLGTYLDAEVVTCGNGTDALQIALMALDLQPGDEVITTAFTFIATAEVISLLGLIPVFVDIDPHTYNIDAEQVANAVTEHTKCIIPVHLYGQGADMDAIMQIAEAHSLYVIEDNAQAIGGEYISTDGSRQKLGTIGHIGTTSFYPSKNLGAYGDGGAIFTKDTVLAERLTKIANHGQSSKYHSDLIGVNSRLDALQAAVLGIKLKRLDEYIAARQQAAAYYDAAFAEHEGITLPHRAAYSSHVFHQYTLRVNGDRDTIKSQLAEAGIPSMIYYPYPLHQHPAFEAVTPSNLSLPQTEVAAKCVISLPMHTELDEEQLAFISKTFLEIVDNN